ncbi:MAG: amidohydrolase family protein, partial [Candidatus Aenigmatarchaeota archaeon]
MSSSGSIEDFEARKGLIAMVTGGEPADTVILNGSLVNVLTGEVLTKDIAVKNGRIAAVADGVDQYVGASTRTIDAEGLYITPGFIDAHLHIESSLLSPARFAELVAKKGVTTVFYDPHEIANVSGLKGVKWMYDELEKVPLNGFLTVPSCVPASSPALETTGAKFGIEEIDRALGWENTAALGEVMNFPGVLSLNEETLEKIERAFQRGLPVEGHASGLVGGKLDGYGSAGIESDHEA